MQTKLKTCQGCMQERPIWKNHQGKRYCAYCWRDMKPEVPPKAARTRIKPISDKKRKLDVAYSALRTAFLKTNNSCRAQLPGCQHTRDLELTVHHTKGRGIYYLDTTTWIPLCMSCHRWVEEHPEDAKALNLSQSRLT